MNKHLSPHQWLRHWLIRTRWRRWLLPAVCAIPYAASMLWLVSRNQFWIAQILLTPLLMVLILGLLSLWLANKEFRG